MPENEFPKLPLPFILSNLMQILKSTAIHHSDPNRVYPLNKAVSLLSRVISHTRRVFKLNWLKNLERRQTKQNVLFLPVGDERDIFEVLGGNVHF